MRAVAVAVGSRIFIFAIAFAAVAIIGVKGLPFGWRFPIAAEVFHGSLGDLLNPWAHWDGVWYIKIAKSGYADLDGSTAFFPLFPLLLRYVGVILRGNLVVTGVALSLLFYSVSIWLFYRLVRRDFDDGTASRAVIYLALGPLAFFFQAVYTESLFLMLALACFVFAREGRWRLAGVAGLLATLTRSTGVLLLIPMLIYYYRDRGWDWRRTDSHVASLLMVVEGLLVWMAYLALVFARPLSFLGAQAQWERHLAPPNFTVFRGLQAAVGGALQLVTHQYFRLYWSVPSPSGAWDVGVTNIVAFSALALSGFLLWYGCRRLPPAYTYFALASLAYPLFFPSNYMPLMSYPRFAAVVFPLYVSLALLTKGRRWLHVAVIVVGVLLLIALTAKFAVFSFVA